MNDSAQTLLTRRLELRWLTEADVDLLLAIWNDPGYIQNVGDRGIRTPEAALEAMRSILFTLYDEHGFGPYVLTRRGGGPPMGVCGLFKRSALEHPDIGYALLPDFRGCGYALEAARAVVAHARDTLRLGQIQAIVSPSNPRSIQLLEALGMRRRAPIRLPGEDADVLLYALSFDQ